MTAPERERSLLDRCRYEITNLMDKMQRKEAAGWEGVQRRILLMSDLNKALSEANAPAVTVTEEMVERAAEVIAGDTAPVSFCRHTARIALERALKSTTPQTGSQE